MSRYDATKAELAELLAAEPAYRVRQLWDGLYRQLAAPEELTVLPAALRAELAARPELAPALALVTEQLADDGATAKWLFRLADGEQIETVLMYSERRCSVCVSSQAGCAMACSFCATGQGGYRRQLRSGEILEQVVRAARAAKDAGRRLDHVVFMGMGEPLANFAAVWRAIEGIVSDLDLAARHVTVSTVGVIPGIERLAAAPLQVNLAVSLHAANDALRNELVPLNRRYPLGALMAACRDYVEATHRRVSFEWALIAGVNDTPRDAEELAGLCHQISAHVNLIPLNPTPGYPVLGSPPAAVRAFRDTLSSLGVNATVRKTRGREIAAACGQLAGTAGRRVAAPARRAAAPR
ncbi:MAG: 23S rRNA (adenine(2503)-C(2))-methyltransferase RlmN [Actinomycetota bacterium]|nr:23S rRNA (adenine(2503)-C(2))-methyltransferase RlmN [Actinomycetota bacterium]